MSAPRQPVQAPFTEACQIDQPCQRISCTKVLKAGEPRFYVTSSLPQQTVKSKWVCEACYHHYLAVARGATQGTQAAIQSSQRQADRTSRQARQELQVSSSGRSSHANHVDTASIRQLVNTSQRKGSTQQQRAVRHVPSASSSSMGPPLQVPRQGPLVSVPGSWVSSNSPRQTSSKQPSSIGYSQSHRQHGSATAHWRSLAYAPGDNIDVIFQVHREILPSKKRFSEAVGTLAEGLKVPASASGEEIAKRALACMLPKLIAVTVGDFEWDQKRITVRDEKWKDISKEDEEGYFGKECLKASGKDKTRLTFTRPKSPFRVLVVIALDDWERYLDYQESRELQEQSEMSATATPTSAISPTKRKIKRKGKHTKRHDDLDALDAGVEVDDEENNSEDPMVGIPVVPLFTVEASRRGAHPDYNGYGMATEPSKRSRSESLNVMSTPPKSKRVQVYKSPDQNQLQGALAHAGAIKNLDLSNYTGRSERIEFHPIVVPPFHELIIQVADPANARACPPQVTRQGVLYLHGSARLGIGTFKTCHAGRLSLSGDSLENELLGSGLNAEVAVKRFYVGEMSASGQVPKVRRLNIEDERQKTVMEGQILCWSTSLLEFGYTYIDHQLQKLRSDDKLDRFHTILLDRLAPHIPQLRFVRGGITTRFNDQEPNTSRRGTSNIAAVYLLEERITESAQGFTKYINNDRPIPLITDPNDPRYNTCTFLCAMQHILFVKTQRQLFLSDLQGDSDLLTDAQVMTAANIGFGDGNLSRAFEAFPSQHKCNDYCTLFGLELFDEAASTGP
ncbi:hypothetical protein HGRIS_001124 [Hohenbuehelia grisea]|uniref:Alpha-type protein kinase domain-containing protein n=1 Tax=Hohenbuehelia grisea TaxID=104357 RepID=A0ABR3JPD1_9AGAR